MVNLDFMSLNKSWWNLLTDTVLFSISSQSSSTQHKDREVCWKTESRFSRAATAAVGQKTQTVADYVIDSSLLLTPELTAHCLEWLFVKWMNWTDMRQQSEANGKKKKKKNEWQPVGTFTGLKNHHNNHHLTDHSTSLKVKLSWWNLDIIWAWFAGNLQKCSLSAFTRWIS